MKRVFAAIALSILLLQPARAQESMEIELEAPAPAVPKNAVALSFSVGTGLQFSALYLSTIVSLIGSLVVNDTFILAPFLIPGPSLEYERWLSDEVAVGVSLTSDTVSALPLLIISNVGILPTVKYKWLDNGNLRVYSKAAIGYGHTFAASWADGKFTMIPTSEYSKNLFGSVTKNPEGALYSNMIFPALAVQFNLLCFEIPMSKTGDFKFFMELGAGTQGVCSFGIKEAF